MNRTAMLLLTGLMCLPAKVHPQDEYTPAPENLAAREWFQDAKFGMFIHWGMYSVLCRGEWVMYRENIGISDYEKLPSLFNPAGFDPDEWCRIAKDAGMRYITITSKHHDGFAMWDSQVSDYDVVERTPYKRDVLKMLAEACERNGLKLNFYHSHLDWHHPDYWPRGSSLPFGRRAKGDWQRYMDYMDSQLSELLTGYGPIGTIWFDGVWENPEADWRLNKTYSLVHKLQPTLLIGNNHHLPPFPGEDYQIFEQGLPGGGPFDQGAGISRLPLETAVTIDNSPYLSWGYDIRDHDFKSVKELVQYLVKAAGANANLLLNVGPRPDGKIQPEHAERLAGMGVWMKKFGESVYGTRGGPWAGTGWGVTTQKAGKVYVHVLEPDAVVILPDNGRKPKSARLMADNSPVRFKTDKMGIIIQVPTEKRDPYDTVVVLEF